MKFKVTKQGIRDLSHIGSRISKGRKVELPPENQYACQHVNTERLDNGDKLCLDCDGVIHAVTGRLIDD